MTAFVNFSFLIRVCLICYWLKSVLAFVLNSYDWFFLYVLKFFVLLFFSLYSERFFLDIKSIFKLACLNKPCSLVTLINSKSHCKGDYRDVL